MNDGYLGVIQALGFSFAPLKWSYCTGAIIAISQNQALFSLIGTFFGGDGRSSFGLPDLRGRTPMGQFQGPGLTNRVMGQKPGQETVTLTSQEMPAHTHLHTYTGGGGSSVQVAVEVAAQVGTTQTPADGDYIGMPSNGLGSAPEGNLYVPATSVTDPVQLGGVAVTGGGVFDNTKLTIHDNGGSQSFSVLQPSLVVNYCICTQGLFPSRS